MSKSRVVIGLGFVSLLVGALLAVRVLGRFGPVLDGDSILPDTIGVLSSFTQWDYLLVSLMVGLLVSGLSILLIGIVLNLKKKK